MIRDALIIIPNLSNEDQVCDFLFQTAKNLAKDNQVFVPTFSANSKNCNKDGVNYLRPFQVLPFKRFSFVNRLNRLIYFFLLQFYLSFKFLKYKKHYIWMFFPEISDLLQSKIFSWSVIFDIVDFHYSPDEKKQLILNKNKKYLLEKADYIFSISNSLLKIYKEFVKKEKINLQKQIQIVPQGFDLDSFSKYNEKTKLVFPKGKPIIGFIGQISERLDFKLMSNLVKENKSWNFVFVGPWHHESNVPENASYRNLFNKICEEENCFYYGKQPRKVVRSIIKNFDICIIPYNVSFKFNKYSYPMKIFEYFYVGKPVLSTEIKELARFSNFVKIGENSKVWRSEINQLLKEPWPLKKRLTQKNISVKNSWPNKLEEIYEFIKKEN